MSILPPELDANYELLAELGAGGMGAVFKARHRHLDELCVIKVMHPGLSEIPAARDRFVREAKRGKKLRHPHIAEVQAFFVGSDGKAYLVMEYVDGENLCDLLIRQGPLGPKLVTVIGLQSLSALACLHSHQLIHRDISPDNLMITRARSGAPHVKLIDLGIAKALDETMSLTGTGLFIGKVQYAAPEQFRQNADARSDLYSLGVVLYELATGARPGRETDTTAIVAAVLRGDPPLSFSETDPKGRVPAPLRAVILKAIEKKPENRYQTAGEFADALQNAIAADRPPFVAPAPAPPIAKPSSPGGPKPVLPLAAGALLVVLGASGAFLMLRDKNTPRKPTPVAPAPTMTVPPTKPPATPPPRPPKRKESAAEAIARGRMLAGAQKFDEAYAAFRDATQVDPGNAFAWANFGGAAAVLGMKDEARRAYDRALSIDSSNWLANYNLACLLTDTGSHSDALRHLEVAVHQLRSQTKSRDELAAILGTIRTDDALRALRDDSAFTTLLAAD